jgi:hypothetical protein
LHEVAFFDIVKAEKITSFNKGEVVLTTTVIGKAI